MTDIQQMQAYWETKREEAAELRQRADHMEEQAVEALQHISALLSLPTPDLDAGSASAAEETPTPKRKTVPDHVWDLFSESDRPMTQKYLEQEVSIRRNAPTTKASISEAVKRLRGEGKIQEVRAPQDLITRKIARKMFGTTEQIENGLAPLLADEFEEQETR